jgi:uncharacterized DUF497 family protein
MYAAMAIVFDRAKDAINIAVHGILLEPAEGLLQGFRIVWHNERRDYGVPE